MPTTRREPFVQIRYAVLESAAVRSLSGYALRILLRLIVEHGLQKGKCNGDLIVTRGDLVQYGMPDDGKAIKRGWDELIEVGLVECTQEGSWRPGSRMPAHWRATFLPTPDAPPTDEWRQYVEEEITKAVNKLRGQRRENQQTDSCQNKENSRGDVPRERKNSRGGPPRQQEDSRGDVPREFAGRPSPSSIHASTPAGAEGKGDGEAERPDGPAAVSKNGSVVQPEPWRAIRADVNGDRGAYQVARHGARRVNGRNGQHGADAKGGEVPL